MQVSVEQLSGLERRMTVQVESQEVDSRVEQRLRSLAQRVRIPGFRPGKVPYKVVQKRYDEQVRTEVLGELMRQTFTEAVNQENLRPAGGPQIEPKAMPKPGEAFEYSATFEVYPEIQVKAPEGVIVKRPTAEVTDADVEKMLQTLREQRPLWNEVEREARDGDRVVIDFEGRIDGEGFAGNQAENYTLVLGSQTMIPGFEDGLVGAMPGEQRDVEVDFPPQYQGKEVAGKHAVFTVRVKSVAEKELPEINEEFAKTLGVADGSLDGLRKEVSANMQRELEDALRAKLKRRVLDALLETNPIEVPNGMVQQELVRMTPEGAELNDEMREKLRPAAENRVKLGLLVAELIRSEGIKLDRARVEETLARFASTYENPEEVMRMYRQNKNLMNEVEGHVLEEQVVDALLERTQVEDERLSFDEVMNDRTQ